MSQPDPGPVETRFDMARIELACLRLQASVDAGRAPSAVLAVASLDRTIACKSFNRQGANPIEVDAIHLLASISKPILAVAVMQLVEDGLLVLDQPVAAYLPGFNNLGSADITPWHLLTHSSGIPEVDWPTALRGRLVTAVGYDAARTAELLFPPGEGFSYSTLAFFVLAELIEQRSGVPYRDYVQQRICSPLGMSNTSFDPRATADRMVPVDGITAGTDATQEEATDYYISLAMPGAGLWGTAPDLIRFGQSLLGTASGVHLLAPATTELMTREHTSGLMSHPDGLPVGYGLGWRKAVIGGRRTLPGSGQVFEHDGATGGELWIDPEIGLVVVFLTSKFGSDASVWQATVATIYSAISPAA